MVEMSLEVQKNWMSLIKPEKIEVDSNENDTNTTLVAAPLERGFGLTIGNAMRRILLSSLEGTAISGIQIEGVLHEFSSVSGVKEDVTEIVLNLKKIAIKAQGAKGKKLNISVEGPCDVKASMIDLPGDVEIMNPDEHICSVDKGSKLNMTLYLDTGKGYVSAVKNVIENAPIGYIPIDALFSPVRKVSYEVIDTRVGQKTDYDKLLLNVETNGSLTSEDALAFAARILQDQLQPFVNFEDINIEEEEEEEELPFNKNLIKKVEELELSVRSANCLKNANISYIGELVQMTENKLLRTPNFGRKSLNEIREVLMTMDLFLGMKVEGWPPENIEDLSKNLEESY